MKKGNLLLALGLDNPFEKKAVCDYLEELNHRFVDLSSEEIPRADLFVLDGPYAKRFLSKILEYKKNSQVFLPVLVILSADQPMEAFLEQGIDCALRQPIERAALRAMVALLLRLRLQSRELWGVSDEKYRAIFEATGTATILVNADGTIAMANRQCLPVTGYSPEELIGNHWTRYVAPESLEMMTKYHQLRRQEPDKVPTQYEARLFDKAGRKRVVMISAGMITTTAQSIISMLDITERREAEEAARRIALEWQNTFDAANDAMWILDGEQRILRANKITTKYFGLEPGEVIGKRCWEITYGTSSPIPECPLLRTKESLHRESMEIIIGNRWFRVDVDPILGQEGRFNGAVHIVRDITTSKKAEQEKHRLEEKLAQLQKMEAIGRLAGGIAHDFNNMLSIILGYGDLIYQKLDDHDPLRVDVQEILSAARRSAELTRQLLAFSRKQTLRPKIINLNEIIRKIANMLRRLIGEDICLHLLLADDLPTVKVDPGQIEQVIVNLVVNARDAISAGGSITIETGKLLADEKFLKDHPDVAPGNYVRLMVADTGCGIAPEILPKIFEPFFTTKEVGKGTGLGLSMVYGVVKQSGGFLTALSKPGQGSTFEIYLPQAAEASASGSEQLFLKDIPHGSENLLVVEDEPALRELLKSTLSRLGYRVTAAENGQEALRLVEKEDLKIDLLLSDVVMPGMNGLEIAEKLRQRQKNFKVLFISGYADRVIVQQEVIARKIPFLQKPFSQIELAHKIRDVLDALEKDSR